MRQCREKSSRPTADQSLRFPKSADCTIAIAARLELSERFVCIGRPRLNYALAYQPG